jgi:hypothetical protein
MTIIGTSHFVSRRAANAYYADYGFTPADVSHKLAEGEIHIGPPACDPAKGEKIGYTDAGRRYTIERAEG